MSHTGLSLEEALARGAAAAAGAYEIVLIERRDAGEVRRRSWALEPTAAELAASAAAAEAAEGAVASGVHERDVTAYLDSSLSVGRLSGLAVGRDLGERASATTLALGQVAGAVAAEVAGAASGEGGSGGGAAAATDDDDDDEEAGGGGCAVQ